MILGDHQRLLEVRARKVTVTVGEFGRAEVDQHAPNIGVPCTSFVVLINGNSLTPLLQNPAADIGLQPRAIDGVDGGFAIAGRFDGGTEGFLKRVSATAAPLSTVRFSFPPAGRGAGSPGAGCGRHVGGRRRL